MSSPDDPTRPDRAEQGGVSLDELADLQAGLLTPQESAALQARVDADPDAQALLADLDHTVALLADLDPEPIPDDIAARIDAALHAEMRHGTTETGPATSNSHAEQEADEPTDGAQVLDLQAARDRPRPASRSPRRTRRWQGTALLASAAAVLGAVVVGGVLSEVNSQAPQAGSAPVTLTIATEDELEAQWPAIEGVMDFGFLTTPQALENCLFTVGGDVSVVLGVRPVIFDGQYGMLVASPFEDDRVVLTVLGPTCGNGSFDDTDVLAEEFVDR